MFEIRLTGFLVLFAVVVTQSPAQWNVKEQQARVRRENDTFYRHLPKDSQKRLATVNAFLSKPYSERLLDGWKPEYEPVASPKAFKPRSGVNPVGRWQRKQGVLGAAFRISRDGARYDVNFVTYDRKGSEVFHRFAILRGAVLNLNRPVFDLVEKPFSKIYIVQVGKEPRLLPSADVTQLDHLAEDRRVRARAIAGLTFHKQ